MLKLIAAASLSSFFFGLFGVNWDSVDDKIEREFPTVHAVSTESLQQRYTEEDAELPLIVDVREFDEYQVSHLRGALNLKNAAEISDTIAERGLDKDAEIIVYCSVGYRSAAVASELQERGFTRVQNLEHSIFEWANRGYPLSSPAGPTDKAHPFNRAWGVLLDDTLHAYPD